MSRSRRSKKMSPQDLADKFAKLRLQPSQSRISKKSNKKKKKKADKRRSSPNIPSKDKCAKTSGSHSYAHDTEVVHPVLPLVLYKHVKKAADMMSRPGWCNEGEDLRDLEDLEDRISLLRGILEDYLPSGWNYKRKYASSLISGYDKIFQEDGILHII